MKQAVVSKGQQGLMTTTHGSGHSTHAHAQNLKASACTWELLNIRFENVIKTP